MISIISYGDIADGLKVVEYLCDAETDVDYLPTNLATGDTNRGSGGTLSICGPGSSALVLEPGEGQKKVRVLNSSGDWKEV